MEEMGRAASVWGLGETHGQLSSQALSMHLLRSRWSTANYASVSSGTHCGTEYGPPLCRHIFVEDRTLHCSLCCWARWQAALAGDGRSGLGSSAPWPGPPCDGQAWAWPSLSPTCHRPDAKVAREALVMTQHAPMPPFWPISSLGSPTSGAIIRPKQQKLHRQDASVLGNHRRRPLMLQQKLASNRRKG